MEVETIQREIDAALAHSASYEDSVVILVQLGFSDRTATSIAAAHHDLDHRDLRDETPAAAV